MKIRLAWQLLIPPAALSSPISTAKSITRTSSNSLSTPEGLGYNTPLILDPLLGQAFRAYPGLPDYTIVPLIFSLRWHLYDISGRSFWRGNTDVSLGGSYNLITSGPESHYAAIITGGRYNFIQPNWRIVPYFEIRGGLGWTNAKQPYEVAHHQPAVGQGQDFTFTFLFGPGVRYNFNPRYSASLGAGYMHISNLYLSEPKYYNHGINVVGVNVGVNVALTRASLDDALSAVGLGDGPRAQPQTSEGSDYMR